MFGYLHELDELRAEIERQDDIHPAGYTGTRDGIRLGIATAQDELDEALEAWREAKREPLTNAGWNAVREELLQVAGVLARTVRAIDDAREYASTRERLRTRE